MMKQDQTGGFNHGSTECDWEAAKTEARRAIIDVAARRDLIFYSDLVSKIDACRLVPFGMLLANLLSEIATDEHRAKRGMLSVVVVSKKAGIPGPGFFELARKLGQHVDNDKTFWDQELEKVHETWSSVPKT